jgi:hypothetical protein
MAEHPVHPGGDLFDMDRGKADQDQLIAPGRPLFHWVQDYAEKP